MLKLILLGVIALGAPISAHADAVSGPIADITRVEDAWRKARIEGDTDFLERFHAKEGVIQGIDGKAQTRDADIAMFAS